MLQHDLASQALSLPLASCSDKPVTQEELAQAIVTLEERYEEESQDKAPRIVAGLAAVQQTVTQCGFDFAPEQVLAEVQYHRLQRHQNTVMTQRKKREAIFWWVLSGGIVASAVIVFLLFTNYLFARKFLEVSKDQAARSVARTDAQQLLPQWTFPGAISNSRSLNSNLSSALMTTNEGYAAVWKYYAQRVGYTQAMQGQGVKVNADGIVPNLSAGGASMEGTSLVNYEVMSNSTPAGRMATFVRRTSDATVTVNISDGGTLNKTTISEVVATP